MCCFLPVFIACSFLPEQGCWCCLMIHNSILAKCHPSIGSLHTYLREVLEVVGRSLGGPILGYPKILNPKHLIRMSGTKHPYGQLWLSWRGRVGNLRSGLSVKKQLLHSIIFKQTIQFTSFLSQISLEPVLLRRK